MLGTIIFLLISSFYLYRHEVSYGEFQAALKKAKAEEGYRPDGKYNISKHLK